MDTNPTGTDEGRLSTADAASSRKPPAWIVHLAWRVHRTLNRLTGRRLLWTTSNKRGWGAMQLTTTGRHTKRARTVIIGYLEDGQDLVAIAMNGWNEGHPAWWLNLVARPSATVRLARQEPRLVKAREAAGEERARLWKRWVDADPGLLSHAAGRSTTTPVVVFEPARP